MRAPLSVPLWAAGRQVRPPAGGSVSRSAIHSRIRSPIRWGLVLALRVLRILTRRVLTRDRRRGVDGGWLGRRQAVTGGGVTAVSKLVELYNKFISKDYL